MSVSLQLRLTELGQAAIWNASNTGTALTLTHIQFGSGNRVPSGTEIALLTPQQAVAIAAGFAVSATQIRMSAIFGGSESYVIREVGVWAGDPESVGSKLVCYWSQAAGDLAVKSPGVDFVFAHDMTLDAAVPAGSLTILADNTQSAMLAMIMAHEAAEDPHVQYAKKSTTVAGYGIEDMHEQSVATAVTAAELTGIVPSLGFSQENQSVAYEIMGGPIVTSSGNGAAMMSFHRPGIAAVNFGLDIDNQLKVGGYSMGNISYALLHAGNFTSFAAPLPNTSGTGIGAWVRLGNGGNSGNGVGAVLPAGGTWAYFALSVGDDGNVVDINGFAGIAAGGTVIVPSGVASRSGDGFAWRIA